MPAATASRGRATPAMTVLPASGPAAGRRPRPPDRRPARPPPPARRRSRRMPRPRISIRPASAGAGRTSSRPCMRLRHERGRPPPAARRAGAPVARPLAADPSASRDLPAPAGPRISTAFGADQHGGGVDGRGVGRHHIAGRRTTKRAPSTRGARRRRRRRAVRFSTQMRAAMGFDDLLGDRQAETGILAEALMRAVGVEALEDLLQARRAGCRGRRRRPRSRPRSSARRQVMRTVPPGGENERALSIRLLDHLAEPRVVAGHLEARRRRRPRRRASRVTSSRADFVGAP